MWCHSSWYHNLTSTEKGVYTYLASPHHWSHWWTERQHSHRLHYKFSLSSLLCSSHCHWKSGLCPCSTWSYSHWSRGRFFTIDTHGSNVIVTDDVNFQLIAGEWIYSKTYEYLQTYRHIDSHDSRTTHLCVACSGSPYVLLYMGQYRIYTKYTAGVSQSRG